MAKKYHTALFIFRRDLRLYDNTGLIQALKEAESVMPCFIFDPRQVGKENDFRSANAIQFMVTSLQELKQELTAKKGRLYLYYGNTATVLKKLFKEHQPDALFVNRDYTPFSTKRDKELAQLCSKNNVDFVSCNDLLLNEPEDVVTKTGKPYQVFTPFFKATRTNRIPKPTSSRASNYTRVKSSLDQGPAVFDKVLSHNNNLIHVHGGRQEGRKLLSKIKNLKKYATTRDFPAIATSNLSAHHKFGTISIRETYHTIKDELGTQSKLLPQLYWRDFFTHVAFHFPYVFGKAFQEKYQSLRWSTSKKNFAAWCEGQTGFPIVDAGMRQLNTTGYMHNRTRMIVASFLTKDLHINWLWGEKYFAQQLVDYDPCVNNGSWQWAASTGCDAQPYFRIFNPWLQQKKFDPDCTYIKRWVPELKKVDPKVIHSWFKESHETIKGYPRPMVDHKTASAYAKQMYKRA